MADDVAKEIMNCLKLKDRPSPLQLVVRGRDYHTLEFRDVLKVEVPIENGEIVIKVSYYNNRDIYCTEWKHLQYSINNMEGVVAFLDGFMRYENRSNVIGIYETGKSPRRTILGHIVPVSGRGDEISTTRLAQIRGAIKLLIVK